MEFFDRSAEEISRLPREKRHELLLEYECFFDNMLFAELMTQEQAWDGYFGLLHECDEMRFDEDRARILGKIDTKRYNPFLSPHPSIVALARLRLQAAQG